MIRISEEAFEQTWRIFSSQKETKLSFTDCSILSIMQEQGIKNLATFDEEFKKIKDINLIF
mgnify:CR=1 FL=1